MKQKSSILFLLAVASLLILTLVMLSLNRNKSIEEGRESRNELNVLESIINETNNQNSIINESLIGKTIVINVWASWCGPCWAEMPELNKLEEKYANDEIIFIALNDEDKEKAEKKLIEREQEFNYQLHFGQKELIELLYDFKLAEEETALPLNIIIDSNGKLAFYYMGYYSNKVKAMDLYLSNL